MKNILYAVLFLCTGLMYADAGPKFKDELKLFFYDNDRLLSLGEYKLLLLEKNGTGYDTINSRHSTADYWSQTTLQEGDSYYFLNLKHPKPLIIKLLYKNKEFESDLTDVGANKHILKFDIEGHRLKDVSPLFYVNLTSYFIMLAITLFIEILMAVVILRKRVTISTGKLALLVLAANLITHPLLWYVHSHYDVSILLLEIVVFFAEAIVYMKFTSVKRALIFSFAANLVSFIVGGICNFFVADL